MGGDHLLIPITLSYSGLAVVNRDVLFDTGANLYAMMRERVAKIFRDKTGAERVRLPKPCRVQGYDGKNEQALTHATIGHMTVDGRRELNVCFLEALKLAHDVIIGRLWLVKHDVDISARYRCLKWPSKNKPSPPSGDLLLPQSSSEKSNLGHWKEADHKHKQLRWDEKRRKDGRRRRVLPGGKSLKEDMKNSMAKMDKALKGEIGMQAVPAPISVEEQAALEVNYLGHHEWKLGQETVTVAELTAMSTERHMHEDPVTEELIAQKLPRRYQDFRDVFSKRESDELPPLRKCDHRIELKDDRPEGKGPLYHMPLNKLDMLSDHLQEHLSRGFIVPSRAAYTSPVLFAPKPGGGWRFCVDYRKLNELTKKDKYPPPLIAETF